MDTEYENLYGYSRNPMATAAVILGVISLITCLFFYISVPCGAMAALLAILSRGRNPMPGKSKAGLICGIIGLCFSIMITLSSVWMVLTNTQARAYLESYLQYYLGDTEFDLDSELENMFPPLKGILGTEDNANDKDDAAGDDISDHMPSRQLPNGEGSFI